MSKGLKSLFKISVALILVFSIGLLPNNTVFADIADGTYKVNYEMKEADSDNTSIADGYFSSPATLTVENGTQYIELTVTGADMIKSLSGPNGSVDVLNDTGETRTVKFKVDEDLSQPINMKMHVVVPDLYDTTHTARAIFDVSDLPSAGESQEETSSDEKTTEDNDKDANDDGTKVSDNNNNGSGESDETNPPTGDHSQIALYAVLLLASAGGMIMFLKSRFTVNK